MNSVKQKVVSMLKYMYSKAPFKRLICLILLKLRIPNESIYYALKFEGKFRVKIEEEKSFYINHFGGFIENETFWKGLFVSFENDTGWIWKELCSKSNVIFDVGANTGLYSLVAKTINPSADVHCFEPSRQIYSQLSSNIEINDFDIKYNQLAVSNTDGAQIFYDTYNKNESSASLSSKIIKESPVYDCEILEYKVDTMTLSSYINKYQIQKIDLIKIDVEMHEPEVIEGLGDYLKEFRPVVIIEILDQDIANRLNEMIDINQYNIFSLKGQNNVEKIDSFVEDPKNWNFLFFHKDLNDMISKNTSLYKN